MTASRPRGETDTPLRGESIMKRRSKRGTTLVWHGGNVGEIGRSRHANDGRFGEHRSIQTNAESTGRSADRRQGRLSDLWHCRKALETNAYDATTPARTATASHLRKPKLPRRCRECVHEVDSIVRRQAVCEATHPDRDGPYGHVFATILGRFGPSGPGPGRARGWPHPR